MMRFGRAAASAILLLAVLALPVAFLSSCDAAPSDEAGGTDGADGAAAAAAAEADADADYDFSFFFGQSEDPITIGRIVTRYKAETGISIEPIMTEDGAADSQFLRRYLSSSDPPAAYALPGDADPVTMDLVSTATAAAIGWRFRGAGLAADRRVLADLIGADDASDPAVDTFIEDMRLADYAEWSSFIDSLDGYIRAGRPAAASFALSGKTYTFPETKGRFSSQLNGVYAMSGAGPSFVSETLMDLASVTSDAASFDRSRTLPTPQAISIAAPVFNTYIDALEAYTAHLAGLYAPGIRGDDFIDEEIYSDGYVHSVFSACRAVFMPFDSDSYDDLLAADATQAGYVTLLPVKMPLQAQAYWLSGDIGQDEAERSIRMSTEYSLCVNANAAPEQQAQAEEFVSWLASDTESSDPMQLCLARYDGKGARLPLTTENEREDATGIVAFGADLYGYGLKTMLSDPDWLPDEVRTLKSYINSLWLAAE
jgi:hypothetical protein